MKRPAERSLVDAVTEFTGERRRQRSATDAAKEATDAAKEATETKATADAKVTTDAAKEATDAAKEATKDATDGTTDATRNASSRHEKDVARDGVLEGAERLPDRLRTSSGRLRWTRAASQVNLSNSSDCHFI